MGLNGAVGKFVEYTASVDLENYVHLRRMQKYDFQSVVRNIHLCEGLKIKSHFLSSFPH